MTTKAPVHTLQSWLEGGISVIVGTADADKVPTCCRGIAVATKDNFETITVYVPAATGQEIIANVATTRRVAVGLTIPRTHGSIQIKGVSRGVRLAPASDEGFLRTRLHQFADALAEFGMPRNVVQRFTHWPAFAIDVTVEEVFDQTPGPKAGQPLAC